MKHTCENLITVKVQMTCFESLNPIVLKTYDTFGIVNRLLSRNMCYHNKLQVSENLCLLSPTTHLKLISSVADTRRGQRSDFKAKDIN